MSKLKCKTYEQFLKIHQIKSKDNTDKPITHTKIGGKDKNGNQIWGGKYHIPDEDMCDFWKLYFKHIYKNKNKEYLTECQNKNGGPLLIDLDLRFAEEITERQIDDDDIIAILELFCQSFQELFDFKKKIEFPVYISQKKSVVCQKDKPTKDGIHMVFACNMEHSIQMSIRHIVMDKEQNEMKIFSEEGLNCTNDVKDIFDESISTGRNNWQVYGSRKPKCEAYKIKYIFNISIDNNEYNFDIQDTSKFDIEKSLPLISAKNQDNIKIMEKALIKDKYKSILQKFKYQKQTNLFKKKTYTKKINKNQLSGLNVMGQYPRNGSQLNNIISDTFSILNLKDYHIKTLHKITMILDDNYYNPFKEWIEVGWALHNTDPNNLFWTWVKFSAKSDKFDWSTIPELHKKWHEMKEDGKTFRSIHYWAKNLDGKKYKEIMDTCIDQLVYKTLPGGGSDTDIAILAKNLFMGEFACVSLKEKKWFQYSGHRWKISDNGYGLRIRLSQDIEALFQQSAQQEKDKSTDEEYSAGEREAFLQNASAFNRIAQRLKSHNQKKAIMGECMEHFYNDELTEKMDENKNLLGFENGIYDFTQKCFRPGMPEDYVSFSTKNDYRPFDENNKEHIQSKNEIDDFMEKVFPNKELREYMWDHAASTLIGENRNQKFVIYTGGGGNGKSIWVDLMNLVLGTYSDKMNIALITQKRKGVGGPTPEITKLKGKRFVTMDEPSAGDELNEGIMKQLTGGDEIEARGMYAKEMIKFYPQFELACCTNRLFKIKSTDKGTWRRIRQVDFVSEFVDKDDYDLKKRQGLTGDTERPIYMKDMTMKDKLPKWVDVFTSILIDRVNKTGGFVRDCPMVLAASKKYEAQQNVWTQFVMENIKKGCDDDKIKKTEIRDRFNEWFQNTFHEKPPKSQDLYDQLDKICGKRRGKGGQAWYGWKIIYNYDSNEEDSDSD